jgi:uncharacterized RDD family membrane protein YckC
LAGRWTRLAAFLLDLLLTTVCGFVAKYSGILGLPLIIGFLWWYLTLLAREGQTPGKLFMGIRIVRTSSGDNGGFLTNVLIRELLGKGLLWLIPFYSLVDLLFILRDDRCCIHDLIAGTEVIEGS